jgi:hypothetical protein
MLLLSCLALAMGPTSALGATGRLSLSKPPWLVETSRPSTSGSLPHTGADLPRLVLTGVVLVGAGVILRVRAARPRQTVGRAAPRELIHTDGH